MEDNKQKNMPFDQQPANLYDDDDIPPIDLPRDTYPMEMPADVIPDEVPRRDGPGGDSGKLC